MFYSTASQPSILTQNINLNRLYLHNQTSLENYFLSTFL